MLTATVDHVVATFERGWRSVLLLVLSRRSVDELAHFIVIPRSGTRLFPLSSSP